MIKIGIGTEKEQSENEINILWQYRLD